MWKQMNHHYTHEEKLSLQYAIRLAANPSNPAREVTFPPNYVDLYEQKPKAIKSFGIRISPPKNLPILFDLHSWKKSESNPHILKMISENCKIVIRITNKFILMGQRKTQRLVVLLYQTTIVICKVYLAIHQLSLLKPKQLI